MPSTSEENGCSQTGPQVCSGAYIHQDTIVLQMLTVATAALSANCCCKLPWIRDTEYISRFQSSFQVEKIETLTTKIE